jgi:hypothetical protein
MFIIKKFFEDKWAGLPEMLPVPRALLHDDPHFVSVLRLGNSMALK